MFAALLFLAACASAYGEELPAGVLDTLRKATFEVVVEKPTTDSLSYEKPLPYDLLPYRVRNDKYESIGTAFAIAGGRFVSAAHVVTLASESVRRRIYLRDSDGKVIRLDRVVKFSLPRDFVVFTVKDYRAASELQVSASARKNDRVFAVGNALGDGVITRDGLYTSDTPEEDEGRWNWMRFSAAASPGNSGGPLVDDEGRVVGIVLRKSQNENLNYALPIGEVMKASADKAEIREKAIFRLDITDRTLQRTLEQRVALPLGYREFGESLEGIFHRFSLSLSDDFKAKYRDEMFPAAPGAEGLLYRTSLQAVFPHVIAKQDDGTWNAVLPGERRDAEIGRNGRVTYGSMGNFLYIRMQAPEDVSLKQLHADSKLFMDLLLKGLYFSRSFGSQRVRITSLGPAKAHEVHVDRYGRKWQVLRWTIEHSDQQIVAYALPVPGGYAILMNGADSAASYMYEIDMKTLTDFAFVTYYGTLKQWKDFLSVKEMLPAAFDSIAIEPTYGKEFRYRSKRLSFSYPNELMKVTENSDLHLMFSYFKEDGRIVWDVSSILVGENKDTSEFVSVARHVRPPERLPDAERNTWESLAGGRMPYTGSPFFDKSRTIIAKPFSPAAGADKAPVLYSVLYSAEGSQEARTMQQRLERFQAGVRINDAAGRLAALGSN
jgi:hypothetical protein